METAFWTAGSEVAVAAAAAALSAETPSGVVVVMAQNSETAGSAGVESPEGPEGKEAAAADGGYGEASAASPVNTDPGSGGRYLPRHQQVHLAQTAPTTFGTSALRSTPESQTCTSGLPDTSRQLR